MGRDTFSTLQHRRGGRNGLQSCHCCGAGPSVTRKETKSCIVCTCVWEWPPVEHIRNCTERQESFLDREFCRHFACDECGHGVVESRRRFGLLRKSLIPRALWLIKQECGWMPLVFLFF